MNDEEKKAIEIVKEIKNIKFKVTSSFYSSGTVSLNIEEKEAIDTILNLITKLQKENEEKDKQIDLMGEYMEENMDEYQLDEIYAKQYNCNGMERNWTRGKEKEVKDIKQYFAKLAKEKGE